MKSKKTNKKGKWTPEEIQEARDKHWEEVKESGSIMSEEEWNSLMNYYDDKAYKDESFDEYKERHNSKSE